MRKHPTPKFKIAFDVFCHERESLGGEQEVDMTILLKEAWPPITETDCGMSLQIAK